jgi:predicted ATPase
MIHLASVRYRGVPDDENGNAFPFSVGVVRHMTEVAFTCPVTFFVGENGSGKSTVLEAIAAATRAVTAGSESVERDPTLARQRLLGKQFDLRWAHRTVSGWFLRAEDAAPRRVDAASLLDWSVGPISAPPSSGVREAHGAIA